MNYCYHHTVLVIDKMHHFKKTLRQKCFYGSVKHLRWIFWVLLFSLVLVASGNGHARLIFQTVDNAFQGAAIVTLDSDQGFGAGVQNVQLAEAGVDFDFSTQNSNGTGGFGLFMTSFFPEGVRITFSQPLPAIGFQFTAAECQGMATFEGTLTTEEHIFEFGQRNLFVGAADIGGINSVLLNGTCLGADWAEMRFDSSTLPPLKLI